MVFGHGTSLPHSQLIDMRLTGDGGGGPLRSMIENVMLLKDCYGVPKISMEDPINFFTRLNQSKYVDSVHHINTNTNIKLPKWVGELVSTFFSLMNLVLTLGVVF
jgi:alpha-mannosidase